ncbi:transcriptional regulator [Lacticaseibacillus baoqingensis]|uniref:Transcriptional regulator n=1 Tax=Lacticaseibacillus baoqingensis TaxID=2486013 RepID=A0ABW4E2T2_9LACO|nr:transcriptional regulator [Lacticaseibacillus baoqingensis]
MENFGVILALVGAITIVAGTILLIIAATKKQAKKRWVVSIVVGFAMFVIGGTIDASAPDLLSNSSPSSATVEDDTDDYSYSDDTDDYGYSDDTDDYSYSDDNSSEESSSEQSSSDDAPSNDSSASSSFDAADYSTAYTFDQLARTPDQFMYEKVAFTGQVVQVLEGDDETDLRVAINGTYDNMMLVAFEPDILGGSRVLEGDKITFYGTSEGTSSYESVLGAKITVPTVIADKINDEGVAPDDYQN